MIKCPSFGFCSSSPLISYLISLKILRLCPRWSSLKTVGLWLSLSSINLTTAFSNSSEKSRKKSAHHNLLRAQRDILLLCFVIYHHKRQSKAANPHIRGGWNQQMFDVMTRESCHIPGKLQEIRKTYVYIIKHLTVNAKLRPIWNCYRFKPMMYSMFWLQCYDVL